MYSLTTVILWFVSQETYPAPLEKHLLSQIDTELQEYYFETS